MAGIPNAPRTVIIGTGPEEPTLRKLATDLRVDVDFRGKASTEQVRAAMRQAVLIAIPSQTTSTGDMEGMPVVSVEAGASGRPVVGYRHSGLVDSVLDGQTGLLTDERDISGLRDRITALLIDPDRRLAYSRAARTHVVANFELTDCLKRLEMVYEAVLNRSARR